MSNFTGDGGPSEASGAMYLFNGLVLLAMATITAVGYRRIYLLVDQSEEADPWTSNPKASYPLDWMEDLNSIPRLKRKCEKAKETYNKERSVSKVNQLKGLLTKRLMPLIMLHQAASIELQDAVTLQKAGYVSEKLIARRQRDLDYVQREVVDIQREAEGIKPGFGNDIIQVAAELAAHERKKEIEALKRTRTGIIQEVRQREIGGRYNDSAVAVETDGKSLHRAQTEGGAKTNKKELTQEEERALLRQAKTAKSKTGPRRK